MINRTIDTYQPIREPSYDPKNDSVLQSAISTANLHNERLAELQKPLADARWALTDATHDARNVCTQQGAARAIERLHLAIERAFKVGAEEQQELVAVAYPEYAFADAFG